MFTHQETPSKPSQSRLVLSSPASATLAGSPLVIDDDAGASTIKKAKSGAGAFREWVPESLRGVGEGHETSFF